MKPVFRCLAALLPLLWIAPAAAQAQAGMYGECEVTPNPATYALSTSAPDAITVAVPLPAPGAYNGNTPQTINGGYMYCMAAEIAWRAGGKRLLIKNASFESIITGKARDFDFSIYSIIVTDARKQSVDFSIPYLATDTGVLVLPGSDLNQDTIRGATLGALLGSAQEKFIKDSNLTDPARLRLFQTNDDMWMALRSRQIDAALNDTIVMMRAAQRMSLKVAGRYPAGGDIAIAFPKGSANVAPVNQILADMQTEGVLEAINATWLYPGLGGSPEAIPMWRVP